MDSFRPITRLGLRAIASDLNPVGTVGDAAAATAAKGLATAAHQVAGFIALLRQVAATSLDGLDPVRPGF